MLLVYFGVQSVWALVLLGLILILAVVIAIQAHRNRVLGGNEELPGMVGEITEATDKRGRGRALVRGEIWQVYCETPLQAGQMVRVIRARDLLLVVQPLADDTRVSTGESS